MNWKQVLLQQLRQDLAASLVPAHQVRAPEGVPTGWTELDDFLCWRGFPRSELTWLESGAGGAWSLWIQAAQKLTQQGRWAAWVQEPEGLLNPWVLRHQQVDLSRLLCVSAPKNESQWLWVVQELMSLRLFDLLGCPLDTRKIRSSHLVQLKRLAQQHQVSVVLLSPKAIPSLHRHCGLVLELQPQHAHIVRALHRPTPTLLERKVSYADSLYQLAEGRPQLSDRKLSGF
jgi:hypothetical protein